MGGTPVLGPVMFQGFEVPAQISLGGRQQLVVHRLPGGGRVVDAMGADDAPMRWSGVFSGANAAERVRELERLRRAGDALPLTWDGWRFTVIIQDFGAETANPSWIPYRIQLCVVRDGDLAVDEYAPAAPTFAEAAALGAGPELEQRIAAASAGLASPMLADVFASAGNLARLVTARAFSGNIS